MSRRGGVTSHCETYVNHKLFTNNSRLYNPDLIRYYGRVFDVCHVTLPLIVPRYDP